MRAKWAGALVCGVLGCMPPRSMDGGVDAGVPTTDAPTDITQDVPNDVSVRTGRCDAGLVVSFPNSAGPFVSDGGLGDDAGTVAPATDASMDGAATP